MSYLLRINVFFLASQKNKTKHQHIFLLVFNFDSPKFTWNTNIFKVLYINWIKYHLEKIYTLIHPRIIFFTLIFRGRKRGEWRRKEREQRETSMWEKHVNLSIGCLLHTPAGSWEWTCHPGKCPWPRIKPGNFQCTSWSYTDLGLILYIFELIFYFLNKSLSHDNIQNGS